MTPFTTYTQITQQVYVAEERVKNAHDEAKAEAHSRFKVEKALGALKEEHMQLPEKLKEVDKARLNIEAGLKTEERQAENQRQKLHITEINLATKKQIVLNLKAELQKAKDAARVAREAVEVAVETSYECGVQDTKTRLAEQVSILCRDYCTESWGVAMDQERVPVDPDLRRVENIFFLEDIQEIPNTFPPTEQLPTTQAPPFNAEVSKGAGVDEEKAKPSKDSLTIRDMVSQVKDVELKS